MRDATALVFSLTIMLRVWAASAPLPVIPFVPSPLASSFATTTMGQQATRPIEWEKKEAGAK